MTFRDDVSRFRAKVDQRARDLHNGVSDLAFSSIVEGSAVTGAPGQPVDTGNLRASWQNVILGPLSRAIVTDVVYAPQIEDGTRAGRALTLRSQTGGWHSVALTRLGWPKIVETVAAELNRA